MATARQITALDCSRTRLCFLRLVRRHALHIGIVPAEPADGGPQVYFPVPVSAFPDACFVQRYNPAWSRLARANLESEVRVHDR